MLLTAVICDFQMILVILGCCIYINWGSCIWTSSIDSNKFTDNWRYFSMWNITYSHINIGSGGCRETPSSYAVLCILQWHIYQLTIIDNIVLNIQCSTWSFSLCSSSSNFPLLALVWLSTWINSSNSLNKAGKECLTKWELKYSKYSSVVALKKIILQSHQNFRNHVMIWKYASSPRYFSRALTILMFYVNF